MSAAVKFKQTNIGRQTGELARLKVVQGPDYGSVYVITGARATIGRGDENDLVISDLKSSRKHAEFVLSDSRYWSVKDLSSANGIEVNGKLIRDSELKSGNTVSIGETILEFLTPEAGTMVLVQPAKTPDQVKIERLSLDAQKVRVQSLQGSGSPSGSKKLPLPILLAVVGLLGYFMYGSPTPPKATPQKSSPPERDLNSYLPQIQGGSTALSGLEKTADQFFKAGFREYRERNYLRAKLQFESALQVNPNHVLANQYLTNCNNEIDEEVQFHQDNGRKSYEAGKVKEAKNHFEAILRLLYRDPLNPAYVDARDELVKINHDAAGGNP